MVPLWRQSLENCVHGANEHIDKITLRSKIHPIVEMRLSRGDTGLVSAEFTGEWQDICACDT